MFSVCSFFLCFQITFCCLDTYLLLMFYVTPVSFARPSALVAENLNVCHGVFTLNHNFFPLSLSFFFRAPVQESIRSTYSFVHMLLTMLAAVYNCGHTLPLNINGSYVPAFLSSIISENSTGGSLSWDYITREQNRMGLKPTLLILTFVSFGCAQGKLIRHFYKDQCKQAPDKF